MKQEELIQEVTAAAVEGVATFVHEIEASGENFPDTGEYDEKREDHVRAELAMWVAYSESGSSFDPKGTYLCGQCDMRLPEVSCTHVSGKISFESGSCRLFIYGPELEGKPPLKHKLTQIQADYAERPKEKGFGCSRCEYSHKAKKPDSAGRKAWCSFWGVHVQPLACCAMEDGKDMITASGEKKVEAAEEVSLEGQHKGSIWNGVKITGFTGPEEEGVKAMLSRIPPELLFNVREVKSADELGAKHGRYEPETKTILFNPGNFKLRQRYGQGDGWMYHPELTIVHETGHSLYTAFTPGELNQWFALGNWMKGWKPGQAPAYEEKRQGWEPGTSEWTHRAGLKLPRIYSDKNPNECFADCFSFFLMGKAHQMDSTIKKFVDDYMRRHVKKYPSVQVQSPTKPYLKK